MQVALLRKELIRKGLSLLLGTQKITEAGFFFFQLDSGLLSTVLIGH